MSLLFVEGFDHQNNVNDLVATQGEFCWRTQNGPTIATPGRFGGKCLSINIGGSLTGVLTTPISAAVMGIAMYFQSGVDVPETLISFYDSSNSNWQFTLLFQSSNGSVKIYRGPLNTGTLIYTSPNNLFSTDAWFYFEIAFSINASTGTTTMAINGNTVATLTGLNNQGSTVTTFDTVWIGIQHSNDPMAGLTQYDDIYLLDTTVGPGVNPFDSMQGPCQVQTLFPTGSGGSTQWTPVPNTNANWQNVSETAMDSDTTYNESATVGQEDLFVCGALATGSVPLAVKVTMASRQDAAGTRAIATHLKSSTTDSAGTSLLQNQTYTYQYDLHVQDPNGPATWTYASVNAMQIGYALTA